MTDIDLAGRLDAVVRIIQDPASNLTAVALLAAIVTLIVLIAVLMLLRFMLGGQATGTRDALDRTAEGSGPLEEAAGASDRRAGGGAAATWKRTLWSWVAALLVVAAFVSAYTLSGSRSVCESACHAQDEAVVVYGEGTHQSVGCVSCHDDPLPSGAFGNLSERLGHLAERVVGGSATYRDSADPEACLDCHDDITDSVLDVPGRAVRMSHAEPLAVGMTCVGCHGRVGHQETRRAVAMAECVPCHDDEQASAACDTCHPQDPTDVARYTDRIFVDAPLPVRKCGGCHDEESCDSCHGLRMPHTREFVEGTHAPAAAFDRKDLCWRCHVKDECGACHGDFEGAHGDDFKTTHRSFPRDAACNTCHDGHQGSFCAVCHDW